MDCCENKYWENFIVYRVMKMLGLYVVDVDVEFVFNDDE